MSGLHAEDRASRPGRPAWRSGYQVDPARFAANETAPARFSRAGDVHPPVAERLAGSTTGPVLGLGGGTGHLSRLLTARSVTTVVVDHAPHLAQAPGLRVLADARSLPFPAATFTAAAALWMLYHLDQPTAALCELHRVLQPGGPFVACASGRSNDPELADILPRWGQATSFDAEDAPGIVGEVFEVFDIVRSDAPLVHLPDRAAARVFLRGRGLSEVDAHHRAARLPVPLDVTKRGVLVWARRR